MSEDKVKGQSVYLNGDENAALKQVRKTPHAYTVYLTAKQDTDDWREGKWDTYVTSIATLTGLDRNTVRRALKKLEDIGLIRKVQKGKRGREGVTLFFLLSDVCSKEANRLTTGKTTAGSTSGSTGNESFENTDLSMIIGDSVKVHDHLNGQTLEQVEIVNSTALKINNINTNKNINARDYFRAEEKDQESRNVLLMTEYEFFNKKAATKSAARRSPDANVANEIIATDADSAGASPVNTCSAGASPVSANRAVGGAYADVGHPTELTETDKIFAKVTEIQQFFISKQDIQQHNVLNTKMRLEIKRWIEQLGLTVADVIDAVKVRDEQVNLRAKSGGELPTIVSPKWYCVAIEQYADAKKNPLVSGKLAGGQEDFKTSQTKKRGYYHASSAAKKQRQTGGYTER